VRARAKKLESTASRAPLLPDILVERGVAARCWRDVGGPRRGRHTYCMYRRARSYFRPSQLPHALHSRRSSSGAFTHSLREMGEGLGTDRRACTSGLHVGPERRTPSPPPTFTCAPRGVRKNIVPYLLTLYQTYIAS